MAYPFIIIDYDPQWPVMYEQARNTITRALGDQIVATEHIGSTSVPGIAAKPIIDIMIAVRHLADADECVSRLVSLGYEYAPEYEDRLPLRRHLRMYREDLPAQHLHIVEFAGEFWERHLLFRDYLRRYQDVARIYENLKRGLAEIYSASHRMYSEGKTMFVRLIEAKARAENRRAHKVVVKL